MGALSLEGFSLSILNIRSILHDMQWNELWLPRYGRWIFSDRKNFCCKRKTKMKMKQIWDPGNCWTNLFFSLGRYKRLTWRPSQKGSCQRQVRLILSVPFPELDKWNCPKAVVPMMKWRVPHGPCLLDIRLCNPSREHG